MTITTPMQLTCHPATPTAVVRNLEAKTEWQDNGDLLIAYCLRGDMIRLRIPDECSHDRVDMLWEHSCFEAFVGVRGELHYREFNFSPSGQWAVYDFSGYRQRTDDEKSIAPPRITARLFAGRLELEAVISSRTLPKNLAGADWEIGLAAVVESADTLDGALSYWALHHAAPRPDFHHRDSFTHTCSPHPESLK